MARRCSWILQRFQRQRDEGPNTGVATIATSVRRNLFCSENTMLAIQISNSEAIVFCCKMESFDELLFGNPRKEQRNVEC